MGRLHVLKTLHRLLRPGPGVPLPAPLPCTSVPAKGLLGEVKGAVSWVECLPGMCRSGHPILD